jgi:hypothetical protein
MSVGGTSDAAVTPAPGTARLRWPLAAAYLSALVLVTLLLSVRLPSTEIELEAVAAEFSFRLPVDHALTSQSSLSSLQVAGAESIELQGADDVGAVLNLRTGHPGCSGTLVLEGIVLPRGAQVSVGTAARGPALQLRLDAPGAVLRATLDGCVLVGGSESQGGPRNLLVRLGDDEVDVALQGIDRAAPFVALLPATDLSFSRVEQAVREDGTLVRQVSTLTGGTLVLPGIADDERRLRFGEDLRFGGSIGEIRNVEPEQSLLKVRFHGDVRNMTTGSVRERRSLMPTLLDWLRAQHGVSLLWGSALYVFGVFSALMRWWKGGAPEAHH